jgi:outer membrane protein assembly factor BamB
VALPGGVGPAIDRLAGACRFVGSQKLSQPLRLADGSVLSGIPVADAVAALRRIDAHEQIATLADFHLGAPASVKDTSTAFVASPDSVISNVTTLVRPIGEFARMDRIVTWSNDGLSVWAVGQSTPLWTAAGVTESPIASAWIGNHLAVWSASRLWLLNDGGSLAGNSDLHDLTSLAVASDSNAITDVPAPTGDDENNLVIQQQLAQQQAIMIAQQRAIIIRGGRLIIRGGVVQQLGVPAKAMGAEQIVSVRPAGNRVIVATSTGRVLAMDAADGHIVWQIRLGENAVNQLLANPHYTVARMDDPAGSELVAIDTAGGRVIGRRKFGPENSPTQLVNVALSEEGMLAWTVTNKLFVKDLYEPWATKIELGGQDNTDSAPFSGCVGADQLLIREGRVLAAYDGGKFVRVCDLVRAPIGADDETDPLATGTNSADFTMRVVGPQLFITHSKSFTRYNLADAADHGAPDPYEMDYPAHIREMFLGVDYAILLNIPIDRGPAGAPLMLLLAYRRAPFSSQSARESGVLDYVQTITDPAGILSWQPVNGGMYYLSGDQKLHLLQSAHPKL